MNERPGTQELRNKIVAMYAEGLSQSEIARRLNYTQARICQIAPGGYSGPVKREADKVTLRMLADGYTQTEIAERLGVTPASVCARVKRLRRDGQYVDGKTTAAGMEAAR